MNNWDILENNVIINILSFLGHKEYYNYCLINKHYYSLFKIGKCHKIISITYNIIKKNRNIINKYPNYLF